MTEDVRMWPDMMAAVENQPLKGYMKLSSQEERALLLTKILEMQSNIQ